MSANAAPRSLDLVGRLTQASNATFLARDASGDHWVYKPVAGEAPLWDFPEATLGRREVAAHALSAASGFDVVPETTWLDQAPLGPGSAQRWVEVEGDELVDIVSPDELPVDWFGIVLGTDEDDNDVALVHADHPGLRRLALFDAVINNSDRKGAHVLRVGDRVLGADHGVCFHTDPKLRTVLWGWSGEALTEDERWLLATVLEVAPDCLGPWLDGAEVEACRERTRALLARGSFPEPDQDWPVIPWPPL